MAADPHELGDLQMAARGLLANFASSAAVHDLIDGSHRRDAALEAQMTTLGFYAVLLPGEDGTLEHLARIVTESGAAAATTRILGHAVGLGTAIAHLPTSPTREALLARISAGTLGAVTGLSDGTFHHSSNGAGWRIEGADDLVLDADGAETIVLWSTGDDGTRQWVLDADRLTIAALTPIDRTRALSRIEAPMVTTTDGDLLASGAPADDVRRAVTLALELALAHDSLGIARSARDMTVAYVRTRVQFGRPVGSFQAVKHQAADMEVRTELAQSICGAALSCLVNDSPDAEATVIMARDVACRAASWVAGRAVQLHGGIGYTWEHDAHILLKRAKLNEVLVSSASDRRPVLLDSLGTGGAQ